jgi:hypothetical protein
MTAVSLRFEKETLERGWRRGQVGRLHGKLFGRDRLTTANKSGGKAQNQYAQIALFHPVVLVEGPRESKALTVQFGAGK